MGDVLRESLARAGWRIVNNTPLPLVCFTRDGLVASDFLAALYERQIAWMSEVRLGDGPPVVRACITSFRTTESDIEWVVREMNRLALRGMRGHSMKRETIAIHGGYDVDPTTKAVAVPIYQTVAYAFDSADHGAALFNLEVEGYRYTPHQQSDDRGAGAARRRARGRSRGAVRELRAGGGQLCGAQPDRAGHQHRLGSAALRHDAYAVRARAAESGRHRPLRRVGSSRARSRS